MRRIDPYLIVLIVLCIFALGPLLQPGYFWAAHDARHSVYFLFEFDRSAQEGILYPRWSPDFAFGYGYPIFNIYGPGAFYVGEALHLLGLDLADAVKAVFGLSFVLSGIAMFLFIRRLMGSRAGLIAGLVYVYAPYHLADTYVRGALAESFALAFMPFVLWGFYEAVTQPRLTAIVGAGLAYAGLMFAHNGLTLLFSPLVGFYVLLLLITHHASRLKTMQRILAASLTLVVGLGLSAIFWLPMALEYRYVRTDQWLANYYDYHQHFPYLFQLLAPTWGFGISVPGPHDTMSFQIGAVPVVLSLFALVVIWRSKNSRLKQHLLFFGAVLLLVIFFMTSASIPVWEVLRLVIFAQFPWRLLVFAVLATAVLAGAVLAENDGDEASNASFPWAVVLLIVIVLLGSYGYLQTQIIDPPDGPVSLAGLMHFEQSSGEMTGSTAWVQEIPTWSSLMELVMKGGTITSKVDYGSIPEGIVVDSWGMGTTFEKLWIHAEIAGTITFNTFYYPGWHAYLGKPETKQDPLRELRSGREIPIEPRGKHGLMTVEVPVGEWNVLLRFEDTLPRLVGQAISLLTVLGIVLAFGWRIRRLFLTAESRN